MAPFFVVNSWTRVLMSSVVIPGLMCAATRSRVSKARTPAFLMPSIAEYVVLGAVLFGLGVVGFLTRRNLIVIFLCTELMFQGVVVTMVAFARLHHHVEGEAFALFLLVIAAVEAGLALGMIVLLYRRRGTLDAEAWATMRG